MKNKTKLLLSCDVIFRVLWRNSEPATRWQHNKYCEAMDFDSCASNCLNDRSYRTKNNAPLLCQTRAHLYSHIRKWNSDASASTMLMILCDVNTVFVSCACPRVWWSIVVHITNVRKLLQSQNMALPLNWISTSALLVIAGLCDVTATPVVFYVLHRSSSGKFFI